ncbi:dihydroneopterin aldolase [soil metagenome]
MAEPLPFPHAPEDPAIRTTATTVFVRGLAIAAEIGIYDHEHGRRQPLIVDVELTLAPGPIEHFADTVNYESVVAQAQTIAAAGHLKLVETFAARLARACLEDPRVIRARVRVEKPEALAPHALAAGVEIVLERV